MKDRLHKGWQQNRLKTPIVVLSLGLLLSIGLLAALIVHIARQSGYEEQYQQRAAEQRLVSQRIEKVHWLQ